MKFNLFFVFLMLSIISCSSPAERIAEKAAEAQKKAAEAQPIAADGAQVFKQYCILCHGADGTMGTNGAKNLQESALSKAERITMITEGKGLMTPFGEILSPAEIEAVADYTFKLKEN